MNNNVFEKALSLYCTHMLQFSAIRRQFGSKPKTQ